MYDLGMVYKHQYKYEVQEMQERWLKQHFIDENKWKENYKNSKNICRLRSMR